MVANNRFHPVYNNNPEYFDTYAPGHLGDSPADSTSTKLNGRTASGRLSRSKFSPGNKPTKGTGHAPHVVALEHIPVPNRSRLLKQCKCPTHSIENCGHLFQLMDPHQVWCDSCDPSKRVYVTPKPRSPTRNGKKKV